MSLEQFFSRYAALSLGSDPEALADLYAPTFIVGGPEGSRAFVNDASFTAWLREVAAFNREHGMRALSVVAVHEMPLSPIHTLATVTWGARFDKTGDRVIAFEISYLLERANEAWRILSYISHSDQSAEMAKEGLL